VPLEVQGCKDCGVPCWDCITQASCRGRSCLTGHGCNGFFSKGSLPKNVVRTRYWNVSCCLSAHSALH